MIKKLNSTCALFICFVLLLSTSSCFVAVTGDSGHHKGWRKNSNNPHHPSTTNPGHSKGKGKK